MRTQLRSNFGDHARRVLWTAALLATALVVPATSAVAQLGRLPGNMEEALQPEFTRRDMVIFDSDLRLDDDQKTILASLFADYEKAVSAGIDAIHKELTGLMPAGPVEDAATRQRREVLRQQITELNAEMEKDQAQDPQSRKAMREKADAIRQEMRALQAASPDVDAMRQMFAKAATQVAVWQAEKARLRDIFVGDVQTILQEGQKPLWAPLERRLVRDRTISRGRLSGESVDLIAIVREMALEPAAQEAVRDVLNDYGIRMDVALRERNAYLATSEQELLLAGQTGDASAMSTIVERQLQVRLAVRNANDEFAPAIAAKLPAEAGAKFLQVVHERSFPQVFRPTQFGRLLAAAKELEGLDAAVLKSVSDLEQAYLTELAASNEQLMQVTRSVEPEQWKAKAKRQVLVGEGDSAESASGPLQEENAKRMLMGQRYVQQLQTLLTPEQMAALPQQGERAPRDSGDARGKLERGAGQDKMTKKFDLDGDGVLNEQEREALRQFIASQRGGG